MEEKTMAKLFYQGHGSFRLTSDDGLVIYVDPFAGDGYDVPADIILVSHEHHDHNKVELCAQKPDCIVERAWNFFAGGGGHHSRLHLDDYEDFMIESVEAYNENHDIKECVGFIFHVDGLQIYASGDTSRTKQMEEFAERELDYAIFCGDGVYNMGLEEAAECARLIGAKNNIIIHLKPQALFDREKAEQWDAPNKIIIEPNQEITL